MNLLIQNTLLGNRNVDILVTGRIIKEIGKNPLNYPLDDCRVIKGEGTAVFPSLCNGHTHSPMVLLRGYGDDMPLKTWLETRIWPVENKFTEEDYFWGNKLAYLEMIKTGTTFFNEMYMNPGAAVNGLRDLPLKGVISFPIIDGMDEVSGKAQVKECEKFFDNISVPEGVQLAVAAHSIYANSKFSLEWIRDFANERNLKVNIHLCETEKEVNDCKIAHNNRSPVEYLDSLKFLNNRVIGSHSVWMSERDMDLYAENGVIAVYNPVSNMKLASGKVFPYPELKKRMIPILLGTDGAASNNNLDLFEEMKIGAILQKHHYRDPTLLNAGEIFSIATKGGADVFSTGGGEIKKGAEADFILVDLNLPEMVPYTDPLSNLVYSASGQSVKTVISGGNVLMENRMVEGEDEILENAARCTTRLTGNLQIG